MIASKKPGPSINPDTLLLVCLVLMIFFVPVISGSYHQVAYSILFSCIFILSALSLHDFQRKITVTLALILTLTTWVFQISLPELFLASKVAQGAFFIFIVIRLIKQTASAKKVDLDVIADSINGYLLVGVVYSTVVYSIVVFHPSAFSFSDGNAGDEEIMMSKMIYYTFITYTSTGYGDITPALPGTRSLATLISATGQLYIAIIIATLVGKFSSGDTE